MLAKPGVLRVFNKLTLLNILKFKIHNEYAYATFEINILNLLNLSMTALFLILCIWSPFL